MVLSFRELVGYVYLPVTLTQGVKAKLIRDFSGIHGVWKILLVGKHKQHSITQLVL